MFAAYRLRDHQAPHRIGPAPLGGCSALVLILTCLASCEANRFNAADNAAEPADSDSTQGNRMDAAAPSDAAATGFVPGADTASPTQEQSATASSASSPTDSTGITTPVPDTASATEVPSSDSTSNLDTTPNASSTTSHSSVTNDSDSVQSTPSISSSDTTSSAGPTSVSSSSAGSSTEVSSPTVASHGSSETLSAQGSETSGVTSSLTLDLSAANDAGADASAPTSEATETANDLDASATDTSETRTETSATSISSTLSPVTSVETEATSAPPLVCTVTRTLPGVVRDFSEDHPDMEPCDEDGIDCRSEKGLVQSLLGSDGKPQLAVPLSDGSPIHSADSFKQWFNDVEGVNTSTPFDLQITVQRYRAPVKIGFDSANPPDGSPEGFGKDPKGFFPIDQLNTTTRPHNYSFTYEVATYIEYTGGETLTVKGDDDIFVFLNHHLVIDLGGIHLPEEATINFDNLASQIGLEPDNVYDLRLFFAERHVEQSNLYLSTTARFMNCTPDTGD